MTNEYFLPGQVKQGEYHINTYKYLHNLSKIIYLYHFPAWYMLVLYIVPKMAALLTAVF